MPGGDTLPPLRTVIAQHGLAARRSLGQHFLLDLNLTGRIARAAGDLTGVNVIEVGPGPGGLTRALLASDAATVVAVERDSRCLAALADLDTHAKGRLILVDGDALAIDMVDLVPAPRAIVANLPYNISTPLLLAWLARIDDFQSLTLMFQKEVADRLVAVPGGRTYGRLSVMAQWRATVRPLLTLPARAFTPPPKIDSTVVGFAPRAEREPADWTSMETVVGAAFNQRRKMLRASLRPLGDAAALLDAAGLEPTARAEEIDVAGFAALARAYTARICP
ncbi:MAG: 16S rRNA (adenine(1518)-N(6)/adenine(1519)-N(6))-dimethyltransferase RsmA [Inquilinaceae bacterium]